jgi:TolB protein
MKTTIAAAWSLAALLQAGCLAGPFAAGPTTPPRTTAALLPGTPREDGARRVSIAVKGSLQNPAWSPDGHSLLLTLFRDGYNVEPADLLVVDLAAGTLRVLVSEGSGNVNLPGASWNPRTNRIAFSSSREPHDEIYLVDALGVPGDEARITDRATLVAYEPSQSPDGQWIVFESHALDVEGNGLIVKYKVDGSMPYQVLTHEDGDCRQPNWSPTGETILYQKYGQGQWDIWTMTSDGTGHLRVTHGDGDKTDASFSPDGEWIVYSANQGGLEFANLFMTPVAGGPSIRVTHYPGYDGAPSWSPDGQTIVFESYPADPDDGPGTTLWMIDVPALSR